MKYEGKGLGMTGYNTGPFEKGSLRILYGLCKDAILDLGFRA